MLKAVRKLLIPKPMSHEKLVDQLQIGGVPISLDACRYCSDPCEDGHEDYPQKFDVDTESQLIGTVKPYNLQCVISTGKTDWDREVTEVEGSLAAELARLNKTIDSQTNKGSKSNGSAITHEIAGVFDARDHNRLSILNGSHFPIDSNGQLASVLLFPTYKLVNIASTPEGAALLWNEHLQPLANSEGVSKHQTQSWILPFACVILLCSHKRRDSRCAIAAPKLLRALQDSLENKGWEVQTTLEDATHWGPPLQEDESDLHELRKQQYRENSKKVLILMNSHVGGHKFAGNMMIYTPTHAGIWYGRVTPHHIESIVRNTVQEGKILPDLLRGGVNISDRHSNSLLDW